MQKNDLLLLLLLLLVAVVVNIIIIKNSYHLSEAYKTKILITLHNKPQDDLYRSKHVV